MAPVEFSKKLHKLTVHDTPLTVHDISHTNV